MSDDRIILILSEIVSLMLAIGLALMMLFGIVWYFSSLDGVLSWLLVILFFCSVFSDMLWASGMLWLIKRTFGHDAH